MYAWEICDKNIWENTWEIHRYMQYDGFRHTNTPHVNWVTIQRAQSYQHQYLKYFTLQGEHCKGNCGGCHMRCSESNTCMHQRTCTMAFSFLLLSWRLFLPVDSVFKNALDYIILLLNAFRISQEDLTLCVSGMKYLNTIIQDRQNQLFKHLICVSFRIWIPNFPTY